MKKVFISFIAMLSVVFFFISGKGDANEVVDNTDTEQQNLEGQVLSHYLKLEEKEGHYTLHFYNKKELKEVLKSFDTELTVEKINEAVAEINDVLDKENGVEPLSDYFKALKNKTLVIHNIDNRSYTGFRNAFSWTFFGVCTFHSLLYTGAALALGVTGVGSAVNPALVAAVPLTPEVGFWERVLIFVLYMLFIISTICLAKFLSKNKRQR